MSVLLSIMLAVALKPSGLSFEGAWLREGSKEDIYLFDKGRFRLVIRSTPSGDPRSLFMPVFLEHGRYQLITKTGSNGGRRDFLDMERTSIQPPSVVRGLARNQPKRLVLIEMVTPDTLRIDLQKWIRIDPKTVPSTLQEVRTMKIRPLTKKAKI